MAEKIIYYEPQPTNSHGFRVEAHCRPDVKRGHNIRDPQYVENRINVDLNLPHTTICDMGSLPEAFEKIFGPGIELYNSTQKRSDRKKNVQDYLSAFLQSREQTEDKRKSSKKDRGKDFQQAQYEILEQIGNRDNFPDRELASKILTEFVTKVFPEKWPLVKTSGAYLHNDEFSIDEKTKQRIRSPSQIHHDVIFTAESLNAEERKDFKKFKAEEKERLKKEAAEKGEEFDEEKWQKINWQRVCVERYGKPLATGLPLQCSMSACLAQMGYFTEKGKGTAQQQWEEDVRHTLQDFAESYGLKIDRTLGPKHKHMTTDEWQVHQDNAQKSAEIKESTKELNKAIDNYNQNAKSMNEKIEQASKDKEVSEKNKKTAQDALTDATRLNIRSETALIQAGNTVYDITEREKNVSMREKAATLFEADLAEKNERLAEEWDIIQETKAGMEWQREVEQAYYDSLEEGYYDYTEVKNACSMKDIEIARLNGELKWHRLPSQECEAYLLEKNGGLKNLGS